MSNTNVSKWSLLWYIFHATNSPFSLASEEDVSSFFSFLGQVRDRLIKIFYDISEQIIQPIMSRWRLVKCNK